MVVDTLSAGAPTSRRRTGCVPTAHWWLALAKGPRAGPESGFGN